MALLAAGAGPDRCHADPGVFQRISPGIPKAGQVLCGAPDPRHGAGMRALRAFAFAAQAPAQESARGKRIRAAAIQVRVGHVVPEVHAQCAAPRDGQRHLASTAAMRESYLALGIARGQVTARDLDRQASWPRFVRHQPLGRMFSRGRCSRGRPRLQDRDRLSVRFLTAQGVGADRLPAANPPPDGQPVRPPDHPFEVPQHVTTPRRASAAGLDARLAGQRHGQAASAHPRRTSRNCYSKRIYTMSSRTLRILELVTAKTISNSQKDLPIILEGEQQTNPVIQLIDIPIIFEDEILIPEANENISNFNVVENTFQSNENLNINILQSSKTVNLNQYSTTEIPSISGISSTFYSENNKAGNNDFEGCSSNGSVYEGESSEQESNFTSDDENEDVNLREIQHDHPAYGNMEEGRKRKKEANQSE
ncbi:hypothetical protein FQR65_LT15710 [Abscondita terminalis]|nr:hypothetical protein FQR65_LT15710 [Abscondita terminalis]